MIDPLSDQETVYLLTVWPPAGRQVLTPTRFTEANKLNGARAMALLSCWLKNMQAQGHTLPMRSMVVAQ